MKVSLLPLLCVLLGAVPPVHGESAPSECEPVASISGPAEVAGAVRRQLRRLGVKASSPRACRVRVTARLRAKGSRIAMRVHTGRTPVSHVVSNARTAAAIIESYVRPDLGAPLLRPTASLVRTGRVPSMVSPVPGASAFLARQPGPVRVTRRAPAMGVEKMAVSVSTDLALSNDDALWQSLAVAVTVPVRGFRIGGAARYSQSERLSYRDDLLSVNRNAKELFAVASMPRRLGPVSVEPGLRAGISWLFTERYEPPVDERWTDVYCMVPGAFDPIGCDPGAPLYVGDGFALANFNLLAGVHVNASVSVWRSVSVEVGGGLDWLPTGGGDARLPPYVERELEIDSTFPAQYFELAAQPATFWRFGIGLRAALQ